MNIEPNTKNSYRIWVVSKWPPPRNFRFHRGPKSWWRYADGRRQAEVIVGALQKLGYKRSFYGSAVAAAKPRPPSAPLQGMMDSDFERYKAEMAVGWHKPMELPQPRNGIPAEVRPGLSKAAPPKLGA